MRTKPQPTKTERVEIRVTPADKERLGEIKRLYGKTPADLLQEAMAEYQAEIDFNKFLGDCGFPE